MQPGPGPATASILLAVDPSLRGTGFAILSREGKRIRALTFGTIKIAQKVSVPEALHTIHRELRSLVERYQPSELAIESVIYVQSFQTAITLGAARGMALLAAAEGGLSVFEYPPRRVKQAVVGRGGAQKEQVAFMIRALLELTETPPPDAADALAVGLTHFQTLQIPPRSGK